MPVLPTSAITAPRATRCPAVTLIFELWPYSVSAPPEWSYNHNPNGGTSKGWALEALKAPGITVELWDQIPTSDARKLGATAADALIEYFSR